MNVLFDTDVLLDVLLDREPFSAASSQTLSMAERGPLRGFVCATSITTIFYLGAKAVGRTEARRQVALLLSILEIAPVNRGVLEAALSSRIRDFEDGVVVSSGEAVAAQLVLTRNLKDYRHSSLPVSSPSDFLAALEAGGG